ncbi:MAG: Asp-tRNA(Asn)/Glu-tRNA(Gln) amidotransferase subunit GatB [Trueperaceae bacterium]|nr:MAG: Asp-tRNA(Asn)/Glu-tRNA(Gln) amidotransferase subunit GatB [Trueperaceae bacterium]
MFEAVIGLEIHLALRTGSKMFCGCAAESLGLLPNVNTCPVCLGLPGSLPVVNREAIEKALRFSLALNCQVPEVTQFHRKHYYYPDAPKNYQISQFDRPVGEHGFVELEAGRRIGVTRCHVEEDAGRSVHPPYAPYSLVDLNRAGAPLIEMVTEPDLRTPEEAREFLVKIRAIAQALDVSDASPEAGKMRADVNVSIRLPGEALGTKVEVKNLNSFKSVQNALAFEIKRQTDLLESGRSVLQETRGWNEGGQRTYSMRSKEETADYRYFPDPDLPPMRVAEKWLETVRAATPELPDAKRERYRELGLRAFDAGLIAFDVELATFFDRAVRVYEGEAQLLANWLNGDVAGHLNANDLALSRSKLSPENLASLLTLVDEGAISGKTAKDVLPLVIDGGDPKTIVEERGLKQITDLGAIEALVDAVIAANPAVVERVKENPKVINVLLGQVMKESRGKAKPDAVRELLNEKLG